MRFALRVVRDGPLLVTRFLVDDLDVIPEDLVGVDPDWVLPPLSAALLPTGVGGSALVGRGVDTGDASFTVQVRRVADRVVWEPDRHALDRTLGSPFDFALGQYLDALDAACHDLLLQDRGRRLARATELVLRSYCGKYDVDRKVEIPMAWQTGQQAVAFRHERQLRAVSLAELPADDDAAVVRLVHLALDPALLGQPEM